MDLKTTIYLLVIISGFCKISKALQSCYECSSKTALCRYSVYDEKYLSKIPCLSSCFLRTEGESPETMMIYRGCFDGWVGGMVSNNYEGCKTQEYLGEKVEWCFCKKNVDGTPCNGASRSALALMAPRGASEENTIFNALQVLRLMNQRKNVYQYMQTTTTAKPVVKTELQAQYDDVTTKYITTTKRPTKQDSDETNFDVYYRNNERKVENQRKKSNNQIVQQKTTTTISTTSRFDSCKGKPDGFYEDADDCSYFYLCSNGQPYAMQCPLGTTWDSQNQACLLTYNRNQPCSSSSGSNVRSESRQQNRNRGRSRDNKTRKTSTQDGYRQDSPYNWRLYDTVHG